MSERVEGVEVKPATLVLVNQIEPKPVSESRTNDSFAILSSFRKVSCIIPGTQT